MITSYGVCCTRFNEEKNNFEILLIKKRVSYAFVDFVNGKYEEKNLRAMFNNMKTEEKNIILSCNYDFIYYYAFLTLYHELSNKIAFDRNKKRFKRIPKCELQYLMKDTKSIKSIWEFPKGRPNFDEPPIEAAKREFIEETKIDDLVFHENKPSVCVLDKIYQYVLFHAKCDKIYEFKYDETPNREISEIKWCTFAEAKSLLGNQELIHVLTDAFKVAQSNKKTK